MPTYNFKKETKIYVVRNGLRHRLDVYPDFTFSQTFNETQVPVKTLHAQYDMFAGAVITKANPANFSFTMPILLQADLNVMLELLLDYDANSVEATLNTADLYVESNSEVYKLEKAVLESGTFQIVKDSPLAVTLSGTGRKLSKFVGPIPGTLQSRTSTRTHTLISAMLVAVAGVTQSGITAVTVELKNDVRWLDFGTLHNSIGISDASGTSFPEAFVVGSRTLSGTIQQYITDEANSNVNTWGNNVPISIQVGTPGPVWNLEFLIPNAVFTNRIEVQEAFIQSYEFRMTSNPTLATVIKKRNI
jgi:hypothetical protein